MYTLKRLLLTGFINLIGLTVFAQTEWVIQYHERPVGKNLLTNKEITAKEIVFPLDIYHVYPDTLSNCITLQIRGKSKNGKYYNDEGWFTIFDLAKDTAKWLKAISYPVSGIVQQGNLIVQVIGNKSYRLNPENGEEQWEVKNTFSYVDFDHQIALGYKIKTFRDINNTLEGIDLRNGQVLWKREMDHEFGWDKVMRLNDSCLMIVSSGLHEVNVKNGTGWDYDTPTGLSNGARSVGGIASNVLMDNTDLYFAAKEQIARLNHQGQIIWSAPLPLDLTSQSILFKMDDRIGMINTGYVDMGVLYHDNVPFIAAFDIKTGHQLYVSRSSVKNDIVHGFHISEDAISLIFKDRISKYSLQDGALISEKAYNTENYGELDCFADRTTYFKKDSTYQSLILSDTTRHFIFTKKDKILVINDQLEIVEQLDSKDLYTCYLQYKDYRFLEKANHAIVIDNNSKVVAEAELSKYSKLIGTKLFDVHEQKFLVVDIDDVINNNLP
ncbi:MAG TPA: PQQ-binding-like beta-propeller repeat protein [Prolixibacteraceae bacterium]|nr:PQQ-binding-like beta-propeller repeat protein [Prolixibacteraceae bacterium]